MAGKSQNDLKYIFKKVFKKLEDFFVNVREFNEKSYQISISYCVGQLIKRSNLIFLRVKLILISDGNITKI